MQLNYGSWISINVHQCDLVCKFRICLWDNESCPLKPQWYLYLFGFFCFVFLDLLECLRSSAVANTRFSRMSLSERMLFLRRGLNWGLMLSFPSLLELHEKVYPPPDLQYIYTCPHLTQIIFSDKGLPIWLQNSGQIRFVFSWHCSIW